MEEIKNETALSEEEIAIGEQQAKELSNALEQEAEKSSSVQAIRKVLDGDVDTSNKTKIIVSGMGQPYLSAEALSEFAEEKTEVTSEFDITSDEALKNLLDAQENVQATVNKHAARTISDEDAMALFNIINKSSTDPDFDVYAALPQRLKTEMGTMLKSFNIKGKKTINSFCKMMVENFIEEIKLNDDLKAYSDEINKALAIPDPIDMYNEHYRELFEKNLLEKADALTNEEEANKLRAISKAYTDAYTLERQKAIIEQPEFYAKLNKNCNKYFDRLCDSFDFVLMKSGYKNKSIKAMIPLLGKLFNLNEYNAKKYIVALCLATRNYSASNKDESWFMYSSLRNIESLAAITKNPSEFSQLMINNIKEFIEAMLERENIESEV